MNARWEIAAALAAAALLVALWSWNARESSPTTRIDAPAAALTPRAERDVDQPIADGGAARRTAISTSPPTTDPGAALARARDDARAGDEHDETTRALETRVVEAPERRARADAVLALASRLGLESGSGDATELALWLEESARADREALESLGAPTAAARIERFNEHAEERGRALIERFGVSGADEIARRFPMHRLDPQTGALVRVDPHGRALQSTDRD